MNCPLCGADMEGAYICPNCGTALELEPEVIRMEAVDKKGNYRDAETELSRPGIFFDNLVSAQEDYAQEEEELYQPRDHLSVGAKAFIGASVVCLVAIMISLWFGVQMYDPDAVAIKGKDLSMDNRTFSIYYQMAYQSFVSQYEEGLPFDGTRSLKKQYYNVEAGFTWEDYFVAQAYSSAALTEVLAREAEKNGMVLDESGAAQVDSTMTALAQAAKSSGMTAEEYLEQAYGKGMTEDTYRAYLADSILAQNYSNELYLSYHYTDDELLDYHGDHADDYSTMPASTMPNINVRHIYLMLAGQDLAEAIMNQCLEAEDPREEFMLMVEMFSQDAGSYQNGGLLEDVAPGQMGGEFDSWCFDTAGRQNGDMAVVTSMYGWHVVYFEEYRDNYLWKETVLGDMRKEALSAYVGELLKAYDCRLTRFACAAE